MVRLRQLVALGSFACILGGCGLFDSGEMWRSGRFSVYWIDTHRNTALGYDMGGASRMGVVEPCVFAAGANSRFIATARLPEDGSSAVVYVVDRAKYDPSREQTGSIIGPLSEQQYAAQESSRGFPPLAEVMPRSRCGSGA
jgi:hypothetical protein